MSKGKLKEEHQTYLFNAQDCRNRFNSVRPKDSLETTTKRPKCKDNSNNNDNDNNDDEEVDQMDEDFYDTYLENMECIEPEKQFTFNDRNDKFKVDTSTIRWAGRNKYGVKNTKIPHTNMMVLNVNSKQNAVIPTPSISNNDDQQMSDIPRQKKTVSNLTSNDLYEVHYSTREVITKFDGENQVQSIIPNGSFENIKHYASLSFRGDKDQKKSFIRIVAAFVVRLNKKADNNNIVSKRFSNG